jgi:hypothetical protein
MTLEEDRSLYNLFRDPHAEAAKNGCVVVEPKEDELFIDLDSEEAVKNFERQFEKLETLMDFKNLEGIVIQSKSGPPHYHAKVIIPNQDFTLNEWKRLSLQVFLGSDLEREKLNMLRLFLTGQALNLFFEQPLTLVR